MSDHVWRCWTVVDVGGPLGVLVAFDVMSYRRSANGLMIWFVRSEGIHDERSWTDTVAVEIRLRLNELRGV